jgi:hypothetical protein
VTGIRIGAFRKFDADQEIEEAVALAKSVDTAVVIAGLNAGTSSTISSFDDQGLLAIHFLMLTDRLGI